MAREGTKAHQLSLQSGELPMASSAAIGGIAQALRQLRESAAVADLGGQPAAEPSAPLGGGGMQFAVADVEWWRSPWPSHPLLQGVMHRLPTSTGEEDDDEDDDEEGLATASSGPPTRSVRRRRMPAQTRMTPSPTVRLAREAATAAAAMAPRASKNSSRGS